MVFGERANILQFVLGAGHVLEAAVVGVGIVQVNPDVEVRIAARVRRALVPQDDRMRVLMLVQYVELQRHRIWTAKIASNRQHRRARQQIKHRIDVAAEYIVGPHQARTDGVFDHAGAMNPL